MHRSITLPQLLGWFSGFGLSVPVSAGGGTALFNVFTVDVTNFVNSFVVGVFAPVMAAWLVLRGVMDVAEGRSPLFSILGAMFLLSVASTAALLQGWNSGTKFATTDIRDEAQLAAVKLREWTGEKVYARLFDRQTTIRTDDNWLFFNVEGLTNDPKLESAMSMIIAHAMSERASGRTGQPNITVLDECWSLLDSPVLAPQVEQLFRTGRKRGASIWGISQALEDFVGTETHPRPHGPGIVNNVSTKIIGQQQGDLRALAQYLHLNGTALNEVRGFSAPRKGRRAQALLVLGEKAETTQTINIVPTPVEYWVCTTYKRERLYRSWFLETHRNAPLLKAYEKLAEKFPAGLAEIPELPEEISGAVAAAGAKAAAAR